MLLGDGNNNVHLCAGYQPNLLGVCPRLHTARVGGCHLCIHLTTHAMATALHSALHFSPQPAIGAGVSTYQKLELGSHPWLTEACSHYIVVSNP